MPGDPVVMLTGQDSAALTEEQTEMYRKKLGLDKPLPEQFEDYIIGLKNGYLGYSYQHSQNVSQLLANYIPITMQTAIPSVLLSALLSVILGSIAGYHNGSKLDKGMTRLMIIIDAAPVFLIAMIFLTLLSFKIPIFPLGGINSITVPEDRFAALADRLYHLILPVLTITIASIPQKYLIIRNSVVSASKERYVLYAKARGLGSGRIIFIHIFKNIFQVFMSIIGMNLGFIISGSLVTEVIFSINGMGSLMYNAAVYRDYPTLQGCLLVTGIMVVAANVITDLICWATDPKQRNISRGINQGGTV